MTSLAIDTGGLDAQTDIALPSGHVAQPHHHFRLPPQPETTFDWVRRIGRPIARIGMGVSLVLFGLAQAASAWISAIHSTPAPDMSGLLATIAPIAAMFGFDVYQYSRERMQGVG